MQEGEAEEIALAESPANATRQPFEAAGVPRKRWRAGRTLTVRFLDGARELHGRIEGAVRAWTQSANVRFEFVHRGQAPIRITLRDSGAWSALGTDALLREVYPSDAPTMSLAPLARWSSDTEVNRFARHEFGHVLGLIHEHQSPGQTFTWNRAEVYRAMAGPPNYWDEPTVDVNFFERYDRTVTQFTAFDPDSVMLYAFPASWTVQGLAWHENSELSSADRTFVASLYPRAEEGEPTAPHERR
jgi:hypothetical protein